MPVLGIETSCDETAVAILEGRNVLADLIASQDDLHTRFGGVVPELASRRHLEVLSAMTTEAMQTASITWTDLDGIAVTRAPGLIGALLVGLSFAKGLAFAHALPLVGVNHLEGHLLVAGIDAPDLQPPFLGLVVSGGHTSVYFCAAFGHYRLLGATRDDAAGEAYDKAAKILDLGYPGGPKIDALALEGDPTKIRFPRPNLKVKGSPFEIGKYDLSFSGLKTAMRQLRDKGAPADLAAGFQHRVVEELTQRIVDAAQELECPRVVVAGGVAANTGLRARLQELAREHHLQVHVPQFRYCTDNAVMIAWVGQQLLERGVHHGMDLNATAVEELGVAVSS